MDLDGTQGAVGAGEREANPPQTEIGGLSWPKPFSGQNRHGGGIGARNPQLPMLVAGGLFPSHRLSITWRMHAIPGRKDREYPCHNRLTLVLGMGYRPGHFRHKVATMAHSTVPHQWAPLQRAPPELP